MAQYLTPCGPTPLHVHPIFETGPLEPRYSEYLVFEGISVDETGKQHFLDASVAYKRAVLACIDYLSKARRPCPPAQRRRPAGRAPAASGTRTQGGAAPRRCAMERHPPAVPALPPAAAVRVHARASVPAAVLHPMRGPHLRDRGHSECSGHAGHPAGASTQPAHTVPRACCRATAPLAGQPAGASTAARPRRRAAAQAIFDQDVRPKAGGPPVGPKLISRGDVCKCPYKGSLPVFKYPLAK